MNKLKASEQPHEPPVTFATVLGEELREIEELRRKRDWKHSPSIPSLPTPPAPLPEHPSPVDSETYRQFEDQHSASVLRVAHQSGLVGLALSGGGIRSATFNLGVLQGFANLRLIPMFDYLSTVSGGGYIGSWLEAWIFRAGSDKRVAQCAAASKLEDTPYPFCGCRNA